MSFNPEPEWTKAIKLPNQSDYACPSCGKQPAKAQFGEVAEVMRNATYYKARHIPKSIWFICENKECGIEYEMFFAVQVQVVPKSLYELLSDPFGENSENLG